MSVVKLIIGISIVYCCIILFAYLIQRQMIYFPSQMNSTPQDAGLPEMQIVSLRTSDGLSLTAWYLAPKNPLKPTIIYLHGNAGNIAERAPIIKPYLNEGYGILLVTYRGYSGNPGIPNEEGLYRDARAAVKYVRLNQDNPCIFLMGNSIGTAVAIQIASESNSTLHGLILQSPFTSLTDIGKYHFFYLPIGSLLKDHYNSIEKVKKIHIPTLIILGDADAIIPPKFARKLFDALNEPKEIHVVPEKTHNSLFEPERVIRFIQKFSCR